MEPVTIFKTFNVAEAQLICSRLQAAGFQAETSHELSSLSTEGYSLTTGGVGIVVPSEEAEDAKILIADFQSPTPE